MSELFEETAEATIPQKTEDEAAATIQAAFRGMQARKKLKQLKRQHGKTSSGQQEQLHAPETSGDDPETRPSDDLAPGGDSLHGNGGDLGEVHDMGFSDDFEPMAGGSDDNVHVIDSYSDESLDKPESDLHEGEPDELVLHAGDRNSASGSLHEETGDRSPAKGPDGSDLHVASDDLPDDGTDRDDVDHLQVLSPTESVEDILSPADSQCSLSTVREVPLHVDPDSKHEPSASNSPITSDAEHPPLASEGDHSPLASDAEHPPLASNVAHSPFASDTEPTEAVLNDAVDEAGGGDSAVLDEQTGPVTPNESDTHKPVDLDERSPSDSDHHSNDNNDVEMDLSDTYDDTYSLAKSDRPANSHDDGTYMDMSGLSLQGLRPSEKAADNDSSVQCEVDGEDTPDVSWV